MTQDRTSYIAQSHRLTPTFSFSLAALIITLVLSLSSCSGDRSGHVQAGGPAITVGVTTVVKKSLGRKITLSSELVPFQEIDVYAKESGYVKKLMVDYGSPGEDGAGLVGLQVS